MSGQRFYLDTSALVKLVREEAETGELTGLLASSATPPVASALVRVELRRAVAVATGGGRQERARVEEMLRRLDLIAVDDQLLDETGRLDAPGLRSLDAIHVASARLLADDLAAVVTYDRRMLAAAADLGLPAIAPGARDG